MIPVLGAAQARAFDQFVSESGRLPSLLLMENAGRSAALAIDARIARHSRVACLCGAGNNGGDGFVVARQLARLGHFVRVLSFSRVEQVQGDARVNLEAWVGLGGAVQCLAEEAAARAELERELAQTDVVVDALFGTGLSRPLEGHFRFAVERVNQSNVPVYALDLPSGLHADTGAVLGAAIVARVTLTFGHPKLGLLTSTGADHAGELVLCDLGVSSDRGPAREPAAHWLEASDVRSWLMPRARSAHKGSSGRVTIVAGSAGKTGAALLSGSAALRAGAGLVTVCSFADTARSLDQRVVELMTEPLDPDQPLPSLERALASTDVVVIGPGLGLGDAALALVDHVLFDWPGSKVVDADAITLFATRSRRNGSLAGRSLFTPHPGELARLLGTTAAAVEADRFGALARAVERIGQAVLLKGPHTLVGAPGQAPWVCSEGHPVLASGGTGDVLSGLCGSLAVELPLARAGAAAAFLHGRAARLWVEANAGADRGLLASELSDLIPRARAELTHSS